MKVELSMKVKQWMEVEQLMKVQHQMKAKQWMPVEQGIKFGGWIECSTVKESRTRYERETVTASWTVN